MQNQVKNTSCFTGFDHVCVKLVKHPGVTGHCCRQSRAFLYVLANLPSRSLPIVAGAIVGGAVWGALAWWSGAVLAALASHIAWTGLMLVLPPRVPEPAG